MAPDPRQEPWYDRLIGRTWPWSLLVVVPVFAAWLVGWALTAAVAGLWRSASAALARRRPVSH